MRKADLNSGNRGREREGAGEKGQVSEFVSARKIRVELRVPVCTFVCSSVYLARTARMCAHKFSPCERVFVVCARVAHFSRSARVFAGVAHLDTATW